MELRVAVLTVSDLGAAGGREDASGDAIAEWAERRGYEVAARDLVPDESDMIFMVVAPTFKEWGEFWDGYADSPAAKLDKKNRDFVVPTDSGLWESIKVE